MTFLEHDTRHERHVSVMNYSFQLDVTHLDLSSSSSPLSYSSTLLRLESKINNNEWMHADNRLLPNKTEVLLSIVLPFYSAIVAQIALQNILSCYTLTLVAWCMLI